MVPNRTTHHLCVDHVILEHLLVITLYYQQVYFKMDDSLLITISFSFVMQYNKISTYLLKQMIVLITFSVRLVMQYNEIIKTCVNLSVFLSFNMRKGISAILQKHISNLPYHTQWNQLSPAFTLSLLNPSCKFFLPCVPLEVL